MSGRCLALAMALLAVAIACDPAHAEPCQGRIGPETSISGRTAYDPFSPADVADDYRISIVNTGAASCSFGLTFRIPGVRPALGGTLAFDLTGASAASLLAGIGPIARLKAPLAPGTTAPIEFQIVIPRGQFAAPSVYRDSIALELRALDASDRPGPAILQTATLALGYTVPQVLSVNLKGGETATTLAFGALAAGQQRSVAIEARSNRTYHSVSAPTIAAL